MADYESITNIVLVGSTGNGKSATGNSLLGENMFISKKWGGGVSTRCKMYRAAIQDGPIINVIDTPGIGSNSYDSFDYLSKEIINCLIMPEEGIHAVLFVLSLKSRISQEEESTFKTLQRIFEGKIVDYFIVVFTGGELEEDNYTLDDYLRDSCPAILTRILSLCGGRTVLFDNRTNDKDKKAKQIKQLLSHVAVIAKKNGGAPYTDKLRRNIKEVNDKFIEQETEIEAKNLTEAYISVMKETLQMEHERTMNKIMMAHIVESALKRRAASHKKEMHQLKDTLELKDTEIKNIIDNALENDTEAKPRLKERLYLKNMETMTIVEKMMVNAFKMSEATQETEMDQLKNTLQLNDSQTLNMMAQMSAAAHEREMHYQNMLPKPGMPTLECNIM